MHSSDPFNKPDTRLRRRQTLAERNAELADREDAMAAALLARVRGVEPTGLASIYAGCSLGTFETLCKAWGRGTVSLGTYTVSDFAFLLGNVAGKIALGYYQLENPSYRLLTKAVSFRDFRPTRTVAIPEFPPFQRTGEHAEFQSGSLGSEVGEDVVAASYGAILGLSRHAIVADDVGALDDVGRTAAAGAVACENALFWTALLANPVLRDGNAYFSAAHANVAPAGALSPATLGAAFALLRNQTSPSGAKLTREPRFLVVGPSSEIVARETLLAITPPNGVALVELVVESHITDTAFYIFADPRLRPGWVAGKVGELTILPRSGWAFSGVEYRASIDFGTGPHDWRPVVRGPGV
jgi:hypothetical protein